jgi:hypothetical protein
VDSNHHDRLATTAFPGEKYPQSSPLTDSWRILNLVCERESTRAEMANEYQGLTPLSVQRLGTHGWGNKQLRRCVFKAM